MNILIAPDKFKGSLTADEVSEAIAEGILSVYPEINVVKFPLADGGDGTAAILTNHFHGEFIQVNVHNPLFEIIKTTYGYAGSIRTAFIEMSSASGLRLIPPAKQNPLYTTTLGTGELILDVIHRGTRKIFLGIGGSVTNDAGTGMATALGYKFTDRNGNELKPIGKNLEFIHAIDDSNLLFNPADIKVQVACDVNNPLYGKHGAAYVFSPQKGATPDQVKMLDKGLRNFSKAVMKKYGMNIHQLPGSGAAGGLGAGAAAFLNAKLRSGIELVLDITRLEDHLKNIDLIITGEGKIDEQTFHGKVVDGVTKLALKYNIPVLAVCGDLKLHAKELKRHGIKAAQSLIDDLGSVEEAMKNAKEGIKKMTQILLSDYCK